MRASTAVSLPGWLAAKIADYLGKVHPRAVDPNAPLWPAHAATASWARGYSRPCAVHVMHGHIPGTPLREVLHVPLG